MRGERKLIKAWIFSMKLKLSAEKTENFSRIIFLSILITRKLFSLQNFCQLSLYFCIREMILINKKKNSLRKLQQNKYCSCRTKFVVIERLNSLSQVMTRCHKK